MFLRKELHESMARKSEMAPLIAMDLSGLKGSVSFMFLRKKLHEAW
jgi:hypothetical protein